MFGGEVVRQPGGFPCVVPFVVLVVGGGAAVCGSGSGGGGEWFEIWGFRV